MFKRYELKIMKNTKLISYFLEFKLLIKMVLKSVIKTANSKENQKCQNISFYCIQIVCAVADITIALMVSIGLCIKCIRELFSKEK